MSSVSSPLLTSLQHNGYAVRIVSTREEMEGLRDYWEAINWHPNTDIDYYCLINENWKHFATPFVLVLERGGAPQGLLVMRRVTRDYYCHLGYKQVPLGQARQLEVLYGGILGCDEPEKAQAMFAGLGELLNQRKADLVVFHHLRSDSPLFHLAARTPNWLCRDHLVGSQCHWKAALPATAAEFLQRCSKKHRYWLKRMEKLLEKDFPGKVSLQCFADSTNLGTMLRDVESVAQNTYQRRLGAGARNDECQFQLQHLAARKNWLRVYVLYLEGQPRAFWMGRVCKGVFYSDATGYDPEYRKYELGSVVFMKMIELLCREGVGSVDFGLGDALYKQRFGDQSWREFSVTVFSNSIRGVTLNLGRTALSGPAWWLRRGLRRLGLEQRLKTFWRRRLVKDSEP